MKKTNVFIFISVLFLFLGSLSLKSAHVSNGNGRNPIIWADVPDPSVIRVGETYYMSSTTMHMNPGVPIMKSKDLINWEIINYAYDILVNNGVMNLKNGQAAYGDGSWASSIRYFNGTFYVVTFSYTTGKTHIYQTQDIENGSWVTYTLSTVCHDPSLLFDNDRVYIVYGVDDIRIIELTSDAKEIKPGGLNKVLIPKASQIAGSSFYVPAEGSHIHKINGYYYVFLISWPAGSMRTELVYRSATLTGSYEGKIALRYDGVAQGGLVDTPEGDWYGMLFQDHGSVGRIPFLVPVTWEDDWPVFGVNHRVPNDLDIQTENDALPKIVASDEFDWDSDLPLVWQWNHNPNNDYWSVTERPGFFRIKNERIDTGFLDTQNTLTQRTFGPECSGIIALDISQMQDGDVAGLGALQKKFGFVAIKMSGTKKSVIMVNGSSDNPREVESIPITQNQIVLAITCDFKNKRDRADFYYSLEGVEWNKIGNSLNMSYTLPHFMGYRFALFNYATKSTGGMVDFDYFRINNSLILSSVKNDIKNDIPTGFYLYDNYPNPFNSKTIIKYDLLKEEYIRLQVVDIQGRVVKVLINERQDSALHYIEWDGKDSCGADTSSGIYFYELITASKRCAKKMTLMR